MPLVLDHRGGGDLGSGSLPVEQFALQVLLVTPQSWGGDTPLPAAPGA